MQRYFFHLHECGRVTVDEEGAVLPTLEDVRARAIHQARAIMCAEVQEGRLCLSCNIEVVDPQGALAVNVPFTEAISISGI